MWLGHVTVTGAELYLSAASWSFEAELMDPRRRGEYQGAAEFSSTLGRVWAPALYTFLAMNWVPPGAGHRRHRGGRDRRPAPVGACGTGFPGPARAARRLAQATAGGEPDEPVPPPSLIEEQSPLR